MPQPPKAVSLMLCDKVVIEEKTQKPYLLGVFTGMPIDDFEATQRLDVFAALCDGQGDVTMTLRVFHLNDNLIEDEEIYSKQLRVKFSTPLQVVNILVQIRRITFNAPGTYLFALMAGDQEIAARRIRVYEKGESL